MPRPKVAAAAVMLNGEVYADVCHAFALQQCADAIGFAGDPWELAATEGGEAEDGFVLTDGRFVDRAEAARIALDEDQCPRGTVSWNGQPWLLSEDCTLDSGNLFT